MTKEKKIEPVVFSSPGVLINIVAVPSLADRGRRDAGLVKEALSGGSFLLVRWACRQDGMGGSWP
jgi:hypothetical protein